VAKFFAHVFIVLLKNIFIKLIQRIIRQMHIRLIHILQIRILILHSSKPCQPLFKDKHPQRVTISNQNVKPKIKLKTVYKKRLVNIFLDNWFTKLLFRVPIEKINSLALGTVVRLSYVGLLWVGDRILLEFCFVKGHCPGFWVEVVLWSEFFGHSV